MSVSFYKNILTLVTGGVIANAVTVLSIPFISRLFQPEDFGAFTLFFSIASLLTIVLTLRYEHAIPLPKNDLEADQLLLLSVWFLIVFSAIFTFMAVIVYVVFPDLKWTNLLKEWFILIPFGAFLISFGNVVVSYNTRKKNYGKIAVSGVAQVSAMSSIRISLGLLLGSSLGALSVGQIFGSLSRIYFLTSHLEHKRKLFFSSLNRKQAIFLAKKYSQFPKYSLPTGLLRSAGQSMPVLFLAFMYTPELVGLYGMAIRLARLPISLFGEPIRRTYLQRSAEILNDGNESLIVSLSMVTLLLCMIGLLIYLPIYLWSESIFLHLLGENWGEVGLIVSILTPWFFLLFIQSAAAVVYVVEQQQEIVLRVQIVSFIIMSALFAYAYFEQTTGVWLLKGLSSLGVLTNLAILVLAYGLAGKKKL